MLVRLDAKLDALSSSFAEVKLAVASKADAARVEKLENSLEAIKARVYYFAGALAVLECALRWLVHV